MTENETLVYPIISQAVIQKQQLVFWYEDTTDKTEDFRHVEPHLIGRHKDTGNIQLSAWFRATRVQQLNGMTSGWRLYNLDEIDYSKITVLDTLYKHTRHKYNPQDSRMDIIYCATTKNPFPFEG